MKDLDENTNDCLEINIQALIKAGYYKSKDEIPDKDIQELKKVIEHAECYHYKN